MQSEIPVGAGAAKLEPTETLTENTDHTTRFVAANTKAIPLTVRSVGHVEQVAPVTLPPPVPQAMSRLLLAEIATEPAVVFKAVAVVVRPADLESDAPLEVQEPDAVTSIDAGRPIDIARTAGDLLVTVRGDDMTTTDIHVETVVMPSASNEFAVDSTAEETTYVETDIEPTIDQANDVQMIQMIDTVYELIQTIEAPPVFGEDVLDEQGEADMPVAFVTAAEDYEDMFRPDVTMPEVRTMAEQDVPLAAVFVAASGLLERVPPAESPACPMDVSPEDVAAVDIQKITILVAGLYESYAGPGAAAVESVGLPQLDRAFAGMLVDLLREIGYRDPPETLRSFLEQYDMTDLLQAIRHMYQLTQREQRREFTSSIGGWLLAGWQGRDSLMGWLGSVSIKGHQFQLS